MTEGKEESKQTEDQYIVRCGATRILCLLQSRQSYKYGTKVIARTPRGLEVGEVLCPATPQAIEHLSRPPRGRIVRRFSAEDKITVANNQTNQEHAFQTCLLRMKEMGLDMRLIDVEHLFGGERIIVYYLAENRVDFRDLVRCLASDLGTRIEMRQVGVRDEAKLLADYGDCGKPVCCNTHLSKMPPVSMKMAKLQKAALDPMKISGRCGRLKCCLRYEYDTYLELRKELPPIGSQIVTTQGKATVLDREILTQQLLVQTEEDHRILVSISDVVGVSSPVDLA